MLNDVVGNDAGVIGKIAGIRLNCLIECGAVLLKDVVEHVGLKLIEHDVDDVSVLKKTDRWRRAAQPSRARCAASDSPPLAAIAAV